MKNMSFVLILCAVFSTNAQEELPYREIQEAPDSFSATTVASRMIDGLGFRFYWATEGLREIDLAYKPSEEARTSMQTIRHIYDLTTVILNSTTKQPNTGAKVPDMSFEEMRKQTLLNLKKASDILRNSDDLSQFTIVFKRGENSSEYPFWNQINGPISDAIWHCGQVVSFRRASGNPFNSKASVFSGKLRE